MEGPDSAVKSCIGGITRRSAGVVKIASIEHLSFSFFSVVFHISATMYIGE